MIDKATIDRIFNAADIVEVISEFVSLKKAGQNYRGLSPFKSEKTPSFFVSPSKGIFKCFSTGKGGNVVAFLMENEKLSYPEALRYLAKKYNIEIIEKEESAHEIQQKNERESLLSVNLFACQYYMETLLSTEGKAIGLSYFTERGFREDIIRKFQLGYAREDKNAFTKTATDKSYKLDYLIKTGLTVQREQYTFDRFHGRVMFPIHGLTGQILGFGGRIMKSDEKTAKYINSPESEVYHKSDILYGLYFARQSVLKNDKCYMVEGYTDVISMHQSGIENVVASSGTSLTEDQIRLIKRFTNNLTILYDGDSAGIKAAIRGIDMVLEQGLNVKVLLLPDGEDPDSFSHKHSSTEVLDFIARNESDFVLFKTRLLMDDAKNDPIKKATLITDIVRSVAIIPEAIVRNVYIKECSSILRTDEALLYSEVLRLRRNKFEQLNNIKLPETRISQATTISKTPVQRTYEFELQEREIIRLLLNYGNHILFQGQHENSKDKWIVTVAEYIITEIKNDEIELQHPVFKQIFDEYSHFYWQKSDLAEEYFTRHPDKEVNSTVADLLTRRYNLSKKLFSKNASVYIETEDMKLQEIVPSIVLDFKSKKVLSLLKEIQLKLLDAQESNDFEKLEELQMQIQSLNNIKKTFAVNQGGRTILH